MQLQVLISTMNQQSYDLVKKMNVQTDAIVVNQCRQNKFDDITYHGRKIKFLFLNERGVGLSRNNALMRATADICLFADDDVVYIDGYEKIILEAFEENPKADVIIFNLVDKHKSKRKHITKKKRIHFFNGMRYGTPQIAVRTETIKKKNIYFSLLFGGGARYGSGEDSLFIQECLKKGLRIYTSPKEIGKLTDRSSTWFRGYTKKFFEDKGALFYAISEKGALFLCLQFVIRKRKLYQKEVSFKQALSNMIIGIRRMKE